MHQDHLSGTSLMTSWNGTSLGLMKYYPYGSTRSGDVPTDIQFTGQRYDDTGLYYYNARYYDPEIGRFISPDTIVPDPMNPQAFNRYSYCYNNPLKYVDPSGNIVTINGFDVRELDYYANDSSQLFELSEDLLTALNSEEYLAHQVVREQDSEWASKLEQSETIFKVGLPGDQTVEYKSEYQTYTKNTQLVDIPAPYVPNHSYANINVSVQPIPILPYVVCFGGMFNDDGIWPTFGGGLGASLTPVSASFTFADTPPSAGNNIELSGGWLLGGAKGKSYGQDLFGESVDYGEFGFYWPAGGQFIYYYAWYIPWGEAAKVLEGK